MAGQLDPTNKSAYEYLLANLNTLTSLTNPLENLNIKFAYMKVFNNGTYLSLVRYTDWARSHFFKIEDDSFVFKRELVKARKNKRHMFLWPKYPEDNLLKALYEHDIWNGINFYLARENYTEIFCFSGKCEQVNLPNLFVNNLDQLRTFALHFKSKASDLIDCDDKSRLGVFRKKIDVCPISPEAEIFSHLKKIQLQYSPFKLTNREQDCVTHLLLGKTAKEIAREININYRTVQTYLNNAKDKIGARNNVELAHLLTKQIERVI